MNNRELVRMANQVAACFKTYPEDEARREVKAHIDSFWEQRTHSALESYIARGGDHLDTLVTEAFARFQKRD
jgi:formate dehydrogenase subunit delta